MPHADHIPFADAVSSQAPLAHAHLAPKLISTPEYAGLANYGYHLDAGKFTALLQKHCTERLGVVHIRDHVTQVLSTENGDIAALNTREHGAIKGDLFIDCTGFAAKLIAEHYHIPYHTQGHILFNDAAWVVQVPYATPDTPIASCTLSTAQDCGWIWDIGLTTRKGVGHVFSQAFANDEQVINNLAQYLAPHYGLQQAQQLPFRKLQFTPGHRREFWHKNCVAVGIAAGFIEPLEATALVLIEQSAQFISEQMPATRTCMPLVAKRFNRQFSHHWQGIIDFLKLHYVLSKRQDTPYWRAHHSANSQPEGLNEALALWQHTPPWKHDIRSDDLFPWASYQYILYGMGFKTAFHGLNTQSLNQQHAIAQQIFLENQKKTQLFSSKLPSNRELLKKVQQYGFQKI